MTRVLASAWLIGTLVADAAAPGVDAKRRSIAGFRGAGSPASWNALKRKLCPQ